MIEAGENKMHPARRRPSYRPVAMALGVVAVALVALALPGWKDAALVRAIKRKDGAAVRRLLEQGADPNTQMYSTLKVPRFLERFVERNHAPWIGDSPLEHAVENGFDFATIKELVDRGAKINVTDGYNVSPVLEAARDNRTEVVELLLFHGADPNVAQSHSRPWTPIMEAVEHANVEMTEALLRHGANPNDRLRDGRSLLQMAAGKRDLIALLKRHGAK